MGRKHHSKRCGVRHEIKRRPWTNTEIDLVLDEILPLNDRKKLFAAESRLAEKLNRGRYLTGAHKIYGKGRSRKPVDLMLWKLASGYGRFGRFPGRIMRRDGADWTWMEKRILKIAFDPANDAAKARKFKTDKRIESPSFAFIAAVLGRGESAIRAAVQKFVFQQPAAGAGFGL